MVYLSEGIPMLDGLEPMCPKLIGSWDAAPKRASKSRMGIFPWGSAWRGHIIVLMIPLPLYHPSKSV